MSSEASLTSWGEGASLPLIGDTFSDDVTIKMPCGVDDLHQPGSHSILKLNLALLLNQLRQA